MHDRIGLPAFDLVAHDLGGGVGFQYVSQFPATRPTLAPLPRNITRAVEVPESGHWPAEENPVFVVREILSFTGR
ncbi:hypothetical protein [Nonomuraea sp. KM90]|uniref:hypothetical protein n=1 Tax=Nonomuraea sp. KM90 TaxID=3457428 RepID=UPI003FCEA0E6